ncbi:NADH-quinone oxidoreductase subunit L [Candidatus Pseudomonas adelgestsugas]|uniref:NADH-quinone oxidoreductase subunit L n=2 Tax=Candidatus Pseudomonas adelgestsugas TaxID=1302376 RepID=A0ABX5R9A5_9PSED|nr:NADH-quinone oxidoreductase subunit L [Candidatus Pseudomonas adelgestsugas]
MIFLTFIFPLIGFLLLSFSRGRWSENISALIGVGSISLSALVATYVIWKFNVMPPAGGHYTIVLWQWMSVAGFKPDFTLYLDGLSITMIGVVVGVGLLIHLFASWYMRGETGYSRFFSYTNLFVAEMLFLVLGDNLLFLYFGWEGVGLCSYLLIGFYYKNNNNCNAALKAFVITRIGDVFMAISLFILFQQVGTLNIQELLILAPHKFQVSDFWITLATLMLLGGAVGKSAQVPLQTWLVDAMVSPAPVSALIHAATMVTAGVYLIARTHGLFILAPEILHLAGLIGGLTIVLTSFAALVQTDIKRILAYSTMSQIGYMFIALGVGAWDAAIFHLMTHAFFKALLFLASGAVIIACHHEQNIFRMGGLWNKLPLAYASFIVGGAALAALPLVTAGFYSKDKILWEAFASGNHSLLYAGLIGAFITSLYTFRLIFIAFHGEAKTKVHAEHDIFYWLPLSVLIILSTFIGAMITPPLIGALPESTGHAGGVAKHSLELASGAIAITGILLAAMLFLGKRRFVTAIANSSAGRFLSAWWFAAWGFDWIYDKLFIKPYLAISYVIRNDPIDQIVGLIQYATKASHKTLSYSETGQLRWYAASIAIGATLVIGAIVMVAV